jgi:2-(1,2-epoxy-1,2-dihydrophenyl)acetyl-CoA isomerase
MFQTIFTQKTNNRFYIQLNRPEVFNALNSTLLKELTIAFEQCKDDSEIRVVIISGGNGKAFCSGADLKEGLGDSNLGNVLKDRYNPLINAMQSLPKPIICKLDGVAAGAGMSLALATDMIIADKNTYMSELFVGIGLMPDAGSMYFLPRLIGYTKAFDLCSTGRKVFMEEAVNIGLVSKAVETEKLDEEVEKIAEYYAHAATKSIGQMKLVLHKSYSSDLNQVLEMEATGQTQCGYSEDFAEGVMAFLQKRPANFKGK